MNFSDLFGRKKPPKHVDNPERPTSRPRLRAPLHRPIPASLNAGELVEGLVLALIFEAARDGDPQQVQALFQANPHLIFEKNSYQGATPLHAAAEKGHMDVAELLLARNIDVNARDKAGETALHQAAVHGKGDVVELLLANGADINASDKYGATPLHLAAGHGHADVVNFLVTAKADANARDLTGATPLHYAVRETHAGNFFRHNDVVESLLASRADVDAADNERQTPLHMAASRGSRDMVKLLLYHHANINANAFGNTPMNFAQTAGYKDIVELLQHHGGTATLTNALRRKV